MGIAVSPVETWLAEILADPITKQPTDVKSFPTKDAILDARVFLKNTKGFTEWEDGQKYYEQWEASSKGYNASVENYRIEIERDRPTYEHVVMSGRILDVGGGCGTVREFLPDTVQYVSVDPYAAVLTQVPAPKERAYSCLKRPLSFLAACAEFLPFTAWSFDWVHMRSVIDHVQIPDLALIEANRVLRDDGQLLVGLSVEGGKSGIVTGKERLKHATKGILSAIGQPQYVDHHTFHPTLANLVKLITSNRFEVQDIYWQPGWNNSVCYVTAKKAPRH